MRDRYLQVMDIPVWRLRKVVENPCVFYRLNNAKNKTIGWLIADDVSQEDLLNKIANALTPHIKKESAVVFDDPRCLILLGSEAQKLFSPTEVKTVVTAAALSDSLVYKKTLWEKLKPLRVLFDA